MKENLNSFSKYKFENDDKKCNNKNKIIMKYMNTVEQELKEQEDQYSEKNKMNSSLSNNECEQESFLDSEENLILSDDNLKSLNEEEADKNVLNDSLKENICSIPEEVNFNNNLDNASDDISLSEERNKDESQQECNDLENLNVEEKEEEYDISNCEENNIPQVEQEEKNEIAIPENQKETQEEKRELPLHDTYDKISFQNTMDFNTTKNDLFYMDVQNINEWKIKYRYLTSSFRKLDKEINKMINKDHINLLNRRSIKQHKDFLDNEYKEWLYTLQKTISEYKKNISSSVSDLNEKEYFILSKNIFDDFKEKSIEENNINITLYMLIMKHEVSVDEGILKYLEDNYMSSNIDKGVYGIIQKLVETRNHIEDIGGKTGKWNDDENNYFMRVYESNISLGDEIIINILKNCINKSEEEILEHITWYKEFLIYNNLKNKYINTINIININEQKKNSIKDVEKKFMIQQWKEKKKQETESKIKEKEQTKKEEMKINKKLREDIKKKKQIIQEQLSIKKEEIKKNKTEKRQKNVLSEEMLQRINERNERLLQKKVQYNNNIIEENNNEKDKKTKQKYMHIQSKLLSNTGKKKKKKNVRNKHVMRNKMF
ncbi:conserved Plasmodium protein, unknown function [Plasmodium sp. gorilla clade G2]|uniref:conserved Plasmodium protein, unknown function n=1 Tax=Plasmodium sp. gorilla clade G2 TaxID=880535 RepID=UPI000D22B0AA|nr:conserved Plasmodium protein, unknown function [Plasmodium sp. gorilla clade G2]SOV10973.1 conserved Plasmodium protein, unknown function [Plasmodium sp. gorilla clade G2]